MDSLRGEFLRCPAINHGAGADVSGSSAAECAPALRFTISCQKDRPQHKDYLASASISRNSCGEWTGGRLAKSAIFSSTDGKLRHQKK